MNFRLCFRLSEETEGLPSHLDKMDNKILANTKNNPYLCIANPKATDCGANEVSTNTPSIAQPVCRR